MALHICSSRDPDCGEEADSLACLFVPPALVSAFKKFDGVRSIMGLPLCRKHFHMLEPADFLRDEPIRNSIRQDFAKSMAVPNFDKAQLLRIRPSMPEWAQWEELNEQSRRRVNGSRH